MNIKIQITNIKVVYQSLFNVFINKTFYQSHFLFPMLLLPISLNMCYNSARLNNKAGGLA